MKQSLIYEILSIFFSAMTANAPQVAIYIEEFLPLNYIEKVK